MRALETAVRHWWHAWGPPPALAITAGAVMLAVCALTWLCGTRAEGFLERGGPRVAVTGAILGIAGGIALITADVRFGTHNHAGVYVTLACFLGFTAGMEAWRRSAHRRPGRAYRAQRRQRGY